MLESIEGGEKKEIMDTLSEIKENMEGLTQEEKAHAVKLYKNLPPNTREIFRRSGNS